MTEFSYESRLHKDEIHILTEFILAPPVRVGALAAALGLEVVLSVLPLNISGLIKPNEDSDSFIIKINKFEQKNRQRFTIAHEIAHFLLHRELIQAGIVDSVMYRSKLSSRLEAEANKLAADIVMPRRLVNRFTEGHNFANKENMIECLAKEFQVSKQAMEIRLGI